MSALVAGLTTELSIHAWTVEAARGSRRSASGQLPVPARDGNGAYLAPHNQLTMLRFSGGAGRDRTVDPLLAKQVL